MRLIHAVDEISRQASNNLRSIALHTDAERRAMFVREAHEAVTIRSTRGINPYLDYDALEHGLAEARADAAWVGWGFVAEHPEFVDLCDRLGITFIGPPGDVMRRLGDKIGAKSLAESVGVPVSPWSGGPVKDVQDALAHAEQIGYPLMIKASAGGGGRGIRRVADQSAVAAAFERASSEAASSFGDPTVFMERVVTDARHVEVQIAADHHGNCWALGVRDCSAQRRNQKIIEESASTALTEEQSRQLRESAVALAQAAGYRNLGTVEFLYQPQTESFAFLEVNTRLQVEHPVTELTTGLDLVKLQLELAAGARLEGAPPAEFGHAIEARLNAEDPENGFAPAPGKINVLEFPAGPGVRVDTGVAEGDEIPSQYDAMIAKIIAWGRDRSEARLRLERALSQTTVVIEGGTTNKPFLLDLVARPELVAGQLDTGWVDRLTAAGEHIRLDYADVALIIAMIDAWEAEVAAERAAFLASADRGRPAADPSVGKSIECDYRGEGYEVSVFRLSPSRFEVALDGHAVEVEVERVGRVESRLSINGRIFATRSVIHGVDHLVEVEGVAHRISRDEGGVVRAPAPSLVVSVTAREGSKVGKGDVLLVLESMKMETTLNAPFGGQVKEVLVDPNMQVDAGAPLVRLEQVSEASADVSTIPRITFEDLIAEHAVAAAPVDRALELLNRLRWAALGFDVAPERIAGWTDEYKRLRDRPDIDRERLLSAELAVLRGFTDVMALARNRASTASEEAVAHSEQEYFHRYLRSLDVDAEGLPDSFRTKLGRALAHFGKHDLEQDANLERSVFGIFRAQQRASDILTLILGILGRESVEVERVDEETRERLRQTLEDLVAATQIRYPIVGDLARSLRFRTFDEPAIRQASDLVIERMRVVLEEARADPEDDEYGSRIAELVACPRPLAELLADEPPNGPDPLLEVLTRRYYKNRDLNDVELAMAGGFPIAIADYVRSDQRRRVLAMRTDSAAAATALQVLAELVTSRQDRPTLCDVYLRLDERIADPDQMADDLLRLVLHADFPDHTRRVAVTTCDPEGTVDNFTIRNGRDGFFEEEVFRGLQPMIARRLQLRRLEKFDLQRLPSADDTYLFYCAARDNARDERLIAAAEVRDITPVTDSDGRVVGLPELERVLAACLEGIRRAQALRPQDRRLELNRVLLHVSPVADIPFDDMGGVARRLAPMTDGIGLDQVVVDFKIADPDGGEPQELELRLSVKPGVGLTLDLGEPSTEPIEPVDPYTQRVLASRRRGAIYPYEIIPMLTGGQGTFAEFDLDDDGAFVQVQRDRGGNRFGIVAGLISTPTRRYPEGMNRVAILGDPTRSLGSLAEGECRMIMGALDLAEAEGVPVEWFAVSSGARISMDSGTENMDWIARVLRRIIEFTQSGGEIHVVVAGINVGAQPYWNAEATMLDHTKGILIMTPDSAMVLTGKQALDVSGGVSAEDNFGIGGYDRIMGPNGQAQYWASDIAEACWVLFRYYEHSYTAPGERFPRLAESIDPPDRDVRLSPHRVPGIDFETIGDIFSKHKNPDRKKPFDIRALMRAVADQDRDPIERWESMRDAETGVVWDAFLGGRPVCMIGVESRPLPRHGILPADGPDHWTAGTLFPLSSKKVARGINAASGSRPLVVLANLSGFDGSPESLYRLQLEYGAEIGRAVVNFDGPVVFCVVSRYHGGAFVVFSGALHDNMQVLAVEGSFASVLGGAPAAAVVFAREVETRVNSDPLVQRLESRIAELSGNDVTALRAELRDVRKTVRSEKMGEVAAEFDAIHSIERAQEVGSVDRIVPAADLRKELIAAVERGIAADA